MVAEHRTGARLVSGAGRNLGDTVSIALMWGCGGTDATSTTVPQVSSTTSPPSGSTSTSVAASAAGLELTGKDGSTVRLTMDEIKKLPVTRASPGSRAARARSPLRRNSPAWRSLNSPSSWVGWTRERDQSHCQRRLRDDHVRARRSRTAPSSAYDVATGDEKKVDDKLVVILAYAQRRTALGPGQRRRLPPRGGQSQEQPGHRRPLVGQVGDQAAGEEPWAVSGPCTWKGPSQTTSTAASFESCAAANCHGVTWKDEKAQEWVGRAAVPACGPRGRHQQARQRGLLQRAGGRGLQGGGRGLRRLQDHPGREPNPGQKNILVASRSTATR